MTDLEQFAAVRYHGVQGRAQLHKRLHDLFEVLQLLTGEQQPRAEEHVQRVGVNEHEEHPVELVYEDHHVRHPFAGVERIERADQQLRQLNTNRENGDFIVYEIKFKKKV